MRVHIIGINYRPEQTGIAVFSTGRAEHLASRGHQVTICTAPPYYPQWRRADGYRRFWFSRERHAGVSILRCPLYVPSSVTPLRRVLHEASFIATALIGSLVSRRPDVLLIVSPPLGLAVVAVVLSTLWRVPYVFDVQDLQPDTALDLGMMKAGLMVRVLRSVERLAYRHAAVVTTLTDAMRARVVAKGVVPQKVHCLGLWSDPELFALESGKEDADLRVEAGLNGAFVALHIGNMGVKQGLDVVADAASCSSGNASIRYVLVGDGAVRRRLEERAASEDLRTLSIVPLQPRDRFLRWLAIADVCLVTQQRTVTDVVFPSKVITLLSAGKPVVASVATDSAVASAVREADAGIVVEPEDAAALQRAVERLRDDPALRKRMGANGREYSRRVWDREASLTALESTLQQLAR